MASRVEITLKEPLIGPAGPVGKVVLREPRARDFFDLGEPIAYAHTTDGAMVYTADKEGVVWEYVLRCVVEPDNPLLLDQLCLADGLELRRAILGFFETARLSSLPSPADGSSSEGKS